MTKNFLHKGQHVLVVGAGKSGLAACRLLKSKGCHVCLTDGKGRELQEDSDLDWLDDNGVVQEFGAHHQSSFLLANLIVVSPGVPLTIAPLLAARNAKIKIIGELELAYQYFTGDIIAITGTNGKTTVTSMVAECLQNTGKKVFVGGNIGTPFCQHVLEQTQAEIAVLEVSSFQLDTICNFNPSVGLLLNISPDHLDRYEDYKAYGDSKMALFKNQTKEEFAIICATDAEVVGRKDFIPSTVIEFDDTTWNIDAARNQLQWLRSETVREEYELSDLQLSRPNVQNCMAAICGSRLIGASMEGVQAMLDNFEIPLHRLTNVGTWNGIDFVNDSKATNIGAVESALAGMVNPVVLIAGGRDKGGDYSLLDMEIKRIVKGLILIGEAANVMQSAFAEIVNVSLAIDMDDAVNQAVGLAGQGDVVLLSPACASFDMYESYNDRGNKFMEAVSRRVADTSFTDAMQRAV